VWGCADDGQCHVTLGHGVIGMPEPQQSEPTVIAQQPVPATDHRSAGHQQRPHAHRTSRKGQITHDGRPEDDPLRLPGWPAPTATPSPLPSCPCAAQNIGQHRPPRPRAGTECVALPDSAAATGHRAQRLGNRADHAALRHRLPDHLRPRRATRTQSRATGSRGRVSHRGAIPRSHVMVRARQPRPWLLVLRSCPVHRWPGPGGPVVGQRHPGRCPRHKCRRRRRGPHHHQPDRKPHRCRAPGHPLLHHPGRKLHPRSRLAELLQRRVRLPPSLAGRPLPARRRTHAGAAQEDCGPPTPRPHPRSPQRPRDLPAGRLPVARFGGRAATVSVGLVGGVR